MPRPSAEPVIPVPTASSGWSSDASVAIARRIGIAAHSETIAGNATSIAVGRPRDLIIAAPDIGYWDATPVLSAVVDMQIGRASCRERVCREVYVALVDVSLKQDDARYTADESEK